MQKCSWNFQFFCHHCAVFVDSFYEQFRWKRWSITALGPINVSILRPLSGHHRSPGGVAGDWNGRVPVDSRRASPLGRNHAPIRTAEIWAASILNRKRFILFCCEKGSFSKGSIKFCLLSSRSLPLIEWALEIHQSIKNHRLVVTETIRDVVFSLCTQKNELKLGKILLNPVGSNKRHNTSYATQ